jgi:hypothetical protein
MRLRATEPSRRHNSPVPGKGRIVHSLKGLLREWRRASLGRSAEGTGAGAIFWGDILGGHWTRDLAIRAEEWDLNGRSGGNRAWAGRVRRLWQLQWVDFVLDLRELRSRRDLWRTLRHFSLPAREWRRTNLEH